MMSVCSTLHSFSKYNFIMIEAISMCKDKSAICRARYLHKLIIHNVTGEKNFVQIKEILLKWKAIEAINKKSRVIACALE